MKRILYLPLFLLMFSFGTYAQEFNKIVDTLLKEAWVCYEKADYKCMIKKSKETLKIAKEKNIPKGIAEAYYYLGIAYFSLGKMSEAMDYAMKAVEYAKQQDNYRWIVYSYTLLGEILRSLKKYNQALRYFEKSIEYAKKNKNTKMIPVALINIGNIYFEQENYEKALKVYQEALEKTKKEKLRKSYIALLSYNIGVVYYKIKMYEDAKKYLKKSALLYKEIGNMKSYLESIYFLAKTYLAMGKRDLAEKIIKENLNTAKSYGYYKNFIMLLIKSEEMNG